VVLQDVAESVAQAVWRLLCYEPSRSPLADGLPLNVTEGGKFVSRERLVNVDIGALRANPPLAERLGPHIQFVASFRCSSRKSLAVHASYPYCPVERGVSWPRPLRRLGSLPISAGSAGFGLVMLRFQRGVRRAGRIR
jgi:hypothetical protein